MNKTALYGLLIGVFVPVMAYFIMKFVPTNEMPHRLFADGVEKTVKSGKEMTDTVWHKVPDFNLTNQLGQKVSWNDLKGKIVVADFFFTRCPVICPQMTRNMKRLQDAVKNNNRAGNRDADFVQFLSFSVDPTHDSVSELKKFADRFQINPQNWWLLTGDKKQIYDLARKGMMLGVDTTEADTAFIHPQKFVLIDKERVQRSRRDEWGNVKLYNGLDSNDVKSVAEDIILLTLEKDKRKKFFLADELPLIGVVLGIAAVLVTLMMVFFKKETKRMNLTLEKNDRKATVFIVAFSVIVFAAVTVLEKVTLNVNIGFNPHVLALVNAIINTIVAVLLIAGLVAAKAGAYATHKRIMLSAMALSVLFLITYIAHHLFAGSTLYGDLDKNLKVDDAEKAAAGVSRIIYIILLSTHISLAGISLPFVLFTAYRALINENAKHRKLAKITWPLWLYVAVTGPIVYLMISKYY